MLNRPDFLIFLFIRDLRKWAHDFCYAIGKAQFVPVRLLGATDSQVVYQEALLILSTDPGMVHGKIFVKCNAVLFDFILALKLFNETAMRPPKRVSTNAPFYF
jgi:hypothetical protein